MVFVIDTVIEKVVEETAVALWNRPELEKLRTPIEDALNSRGFKELTVLLANLCGATHTPTQTGIRSTL